jgi:hypothetical protein
MVKGILADVHMGRDVEDIVHALQREPWTEFWQHLGLVLLEFEDVALVPTSTDLEIWQCCQTEELILITNNRNKDSDESLESTIRLYNTPQSLPVFTISDVRKFRRSREYAERVVKVFLDYLLDIDRVRGAGRLYLP